MRDHVFRVEFLADGSYTLAGRVRGPFPDEEARERDLLRVLAAWTTRAAQLGGWVCRRTGVQVVVTLPPEVPVQGGETLAEAVGAPGTVAT